MVVYRFGKSIDLIKVLQLRGVPQAAARAQVGTSSAFYTCGRLSALEPPRTPKLFPDAKSDSKVTPGRRPQSDLKVTQK